MAVFVIRLLAIALALCVKTMHSFSQDNEVCQDKSAILCMRYKDSCEINKHVKRICPVSCGVCRKGAPPPTRDPTETCFDKDESNCERWKIGNRCSEKRLINIMKRLCARTCGHCKPTSTRTTPAPTRRPRPTAPPSNCKDRDKKNCKKWKRQGRCRMPQLKTLMARNCEKSCGFCKTVKQARPRNPCASYPCKNSGTCYEVSTSRLGYTCSCLQGWTGIHCEKGICRDREQRHCKSWKWWGYCDSFNKERRTRAHTFCAKTCGVCQ